MNFNQFFNLVNGEPYETIPPPTSYNFGDYAKQLTSSDINNREDSVAWDLKPLQADDFATTAAEDVVKHLEDLKRKGYNPTRVGPPLSDEEFKKYTGQTW